jgi:hypothetical protein
LGLGPDPVLAGFIDAKLAVVFEFVLGPRRTKT